MRLSFRMLLDFDFAFGTWETHISVLRHGRGEASVLRKMSVPSLFAERGAAVPTRGDRGKRAFGGSKA
jgi:hypothetical protein